VNDVDLRQGIPLGGGGGAGSMPAAPPDGKHCPFKFQHIVDPNSLATGRLATFQVFGFCEKETCEWWRGEHCAMWPKEEKSHA